jgi:hypothetical protein
MFLSKLRHSDMGFESLSVNLKNDAALELTKLTNDQIGTLAGGEPLTNNPGITAAEEPFGSESTPQPMLERLQPRSEHQVIPRTTRKYHPRLGVLACP